MRHCHSHVRRPHLRGGSASAKNACLLASALDEGFEIDDLGRAAINPIPDDAYVRCGFEVPGQRQELVSRLTTTGIGLETSSAPSPPCNGLNCAPQVCWPDNVVHFAVTTPSTTTASRAAVLLQSDEPARLRPISSGSLTDDGYVAVWIALRAPERVARIKVKFLGGDSDVAQPVHGFALLASRVNDRMRTIVQYVRPLGEVTTFDADGNVLGTHRLSALKNVTAAGSCPYS